MAAFPLGVALAAIEMQQPALARAVPIAVGVVVLIAGALQLTAWKARHLACCREAPGRGRTLPADAGTAWRHGLRLGLHCSHCCAGLMAILLVIGVMDLRAMAVVAAAITIERSHLRVHASRGPSAPSSSSRVGPGRARRRSRVRRPGLSRSTISGRRLPRSGMSICAHLPQVTGIGRRVSGNSWRTAPMFRAQHVRSLLRGALVAAWLGVAVTACQGPDQFYWGEAAGFGGSIPSGAAGTILSGVAGTSPTGTAGTSSPGTAGSTP